MPESLKICRIVPEHRRSRKDQLQSETFVPLGYCLHDLLVSFSIFFCSLYILEYKISIDGDPAVFLRLQTVCFTYCLCNGTRFINISALLHSPSLCQSFSTLSNQQWSQHSWRYWLFPSKNNRILDVLQLCSNEYIRVVIWIIERFLSSNIRSNSNIEREKYSNII